MMEIVGPAIWIWENPTYQQKYSYMLIVDLTGNKFKALRTKLSTEVGSNDRLSWANHGLVGTISAASTEVLQRS